MKINNHLADTIIYIRASCCFGDKAFLSAFSCVNRLRLEIYIFSINVDKLNFPNKLILLPHTRINGTLLDT